MLGHGPSPCICITTAMTMIIDDDDEDDDDDRPVWLVRGHTSITGVAWSRVRLK